MAELPGLSEITPNAQQAAGGVWQAVSSNATAIYIIIIACVVLYVLLQLTTHRILVEKLHRVTGGYVLTQGRYRLVYDKKTKRPRLKPMFGNDVLPSYNTQHFQKIKGLPFIGAMRHLSLVFVNKYSPVVCDYKGVLHHIDVKRWQFDTQKAEYIKKRQQGNIAYFLGIYAPLMVIIGALAFWIITIFMQVNILENFGDQLTGLVRRLGG